MRLILLFVHFPALFVNSGNIRGLLDLLGAGRTILNHLLGKAFRLGFEHLITSLRQHFAASHLDGGTGARLFNHFSVVVAETLDFAPVMRATMKEPVLSVPRRTSTVALGPSPFLTCDSITQPSLGPCGLKFLDFRQRDDCFFKLVNAHAGLSGYGHGLCISTVVFDIYLVCR